MKIQDGHLGLVQWSTAWYNPLDSSGMVSWEFMAGTFLVAFMETFMGLDTLAMVSNWLGVLGSYGNLGDKLLPPKKKSPSLNAKK